MTKNDFFGGRLRSARVFQGLSLQELGDVLSISRQCVQQFELNIRRPNEMMLNALAQALEVQPKFFSVPSNNKITKESCNFGSLKRMSERCRDRVREYGNFAEALVKSLDAHVGLPTVNFPQIDSIKDFDDVEVATEKCRERWDLGRNAPIKNVSRVLERAGAVVTSFKDISEDIGAFSVDGDVPIIIRNFAKKSKCRMRFDLAHECGHLVLHNCIETGDGKTEEEARRFASAFLLPRQAFLEDFRFLEATNFGSWSRIYAKISELKIVWGASNATIIRRAYDLGLIDHIRYRQAYTYISTNKQREAEDGDANQKYPELSEIIDLSFQALRDSGRSSPLQLILDELNITRRCLEKLIGDVELRGSDFTQEKLYYASGLDNKIIQFPIKKNYITLAVRR